MSRSLIDDLYHLADLCTDEDTRRALEAAAFEVSLKGALVRDAYVKYGDLTSEGSEVEVQAALADAIQISRNLDAARQNARRFISSVMEHLGLSTLSTLPPLDMSGLFEIVSCPSIPRAQILARRFAA